MDLQKIIAEIRGKSGTADEVRAALASIDVARLDADVEELEVQRRTILLDGTDAQVTAIEKKIAAANLSCERGYAIKAELERRLEEVAGAEVEQSRVEACEVAKGKAAAAAKLLAREYPEIGRKFLTLLRAIVDADDAVAAANLSLPAGAAPLMSAEGLARSLPGIPVEVIEEIEETLFAGEPMVSVHARRHPHPPTRAVTSYGCMTGWRSTSTTIRIPVLLLQSVGTSGARPTREGGDRGTSLATAPKNLCKCKARGKTWVI